jgi:hypothetical protein
MYVPTYLRIPVPESKKDPDTVAVCRDNTSSAQGANQDLQSKCLILKQADYSTIQRKMGRGRKRANQNHLTRIVEAKSDLRKH